MKSGITTDTQMILKIIRVYYVQSYASTLEIYMKGPVFNENVNSLPHLTQKDLNTSVDK